MTLHLQHDDVVGKSLLGATVQEFRGVCDGTVFVVGYLRARGCWHRFVVDEQVLFLSQGSAPDPQDDFLQPERETYVDLLGALGGAAAIERFRMRAGTLEVTLETGRTLVVRDDGEHVRYSIEQTA